MHYILFIFLPTNKVERFYCNKEQKIEKESKVQIFFLSPKNTYIQSKISLR